MRRLVLVLALLGALAAAPAAGAADWSSPLSACPSGQAGSCGRLRVPLDRSGALPGVVDLRVRVLAAKTGTPAATVIGLAGGPGQAAAPLLEQFAKAFGSAARSRRFVAFDQRGTGGSGRLSCRALATARSLDAAVSGCADELGPRRAAYATAASVQDVEAVRAALGVERIVLYGTSYGTKVALDYAATHPQHVDRLVLDSVVLPGGSDPFQRATFASIPRVLDSVCSGACSFTRDPTADLARLVARLAGGPLRTSYVTGDGRRRRATVAREDLFELLLAGDFSPYLRAAEPAAVAAALKGDGAPLARLLAGGDSGGTDDEEAQSDALYLATTCADGAVPWPAGTPLSGRRAATDAAIDALSQSAFAPFDRATFRALRLADICRAWPESPIVQPTPPLPDVPTLILSGDEDLRTPRADARALAAQLPQAQLLEVPQTGHSVLSSDPTECAERGLVDFLGGDEAAGCRPSRRLEPATALAPRSIAALPAPRGLPGRRGRTVTALLATIDDAYDQVYEQLISNGAERGSFGGLRAGSARLGRGGLTLRRYEFVPGVALSGTIDPKAKSLTFTVGGRAASPGRLTTSRTGVTGTLDGRRVRVGSNSLPAAVMAGGPATASAAIASAAPVARASAASAPAAGGPRPQGRGPLGPLLLPGLGGSR